MTIVLLFKSSNNLYGFIISDYSNSFTTRLEHPTSPVLLTKSGPLRDLIHCSTTTKIELPNTYLKFKNRPRLFQSHVLLSFALPNVIFFSISNYPEGNFGGNQLLDSSISLSPLHLYPTSDLHVSIVSSLQQNFSRLNPAQV